MKQKNGKISIVFPVYNEEDNLGAVYGKTKEVCGQAGVDYEMIFVDDGSTDGSLAAVKKLREKDEKVRYLSLSRNFGHQGAIFAGMSHASGDAVITMDADLQHPPSLIPRMVELWRRGAEVVYTVKKEARLTPPEYFFFKGFYWVLERLSGLGLSFGQSDFRLLDRKALKVLLAIPEYHKFLRGQVQWLGFRQEALSYDADKRRAGGSKFSYRKRLSFALDGIFAFSRYPLHIVMMIGIVIAVLSAMYGIFLILMSILNKLNIQLGFSLPPGWATLAVVILFLGSIQLIAIGISGEYIGRIYDQVKGRPIFIVREKSDEE